MDPNITDIKLLLFLSSSVIDPSRLLHGILFKLALLTGSIFIRGFQLLAYLISP
jgi:hypothetical protein